MLNGSVADWIERLTLRLLICFVSLTPEILAIYWFSYIDNRYRFTNDAVMRFDWEQLSSSARISSVLSPILNLIMAVGNNTIGLRTVKNEASGVTSTIQDADNGGLSDFGSGSVLTSE